jgi:DNA polymerase IV
MDVRDPPLEDKVAFFAELRALDSQDEDEEISNREERLRQRSRAFFFKPAAAPVLSGEKAASTPEDATMRKCHSHRSETRIRDKAGHPATKQLAKLKHGKDVEVIEGTPAYAMGAKESIKSKPGPKVMAKPTISEAQEASRNTSRRNESESSSHPSKGLKRLVGTARAESPSASETRKRRKKDAEPKLLPDHQQVFKGMSFFYVPNDDISPARRIRINKAREHGAEWLRVMAGATHVVADEMLKFKDIEELFEKFGNSGGRPIVVNDSYPIECIQFRAVLDPTQKRYQLQGQPVVDARGHAPPPSSSDSRVSVMSLPLKAPQSNPKRWDYVPPAGTPVRSEESSQLSRITGTPLPTGSQPVSLDPEKISFSDPAENIGNSAVQKQHRDDLSDYIAMLQEYKDLPLDMDDDGTHSVMDPLETCGARGEESDSDNTSPLRHSRVTTRQKLKGLAFEDRFVCNQASTKDAGATNPNTRTVEILQRMADYYDKVGDHWHTTGYRKAINTLRRQNTKITTEEEAIGLPSIGHRLAQKIEEIVTTDRLQRLENAQKDPTSEYLARLLGIYGVGTKQAQQWIAKGYRTLEDVRANVSLTPNQLVGIEHYDELNTKIPRHEVEALGAVVKKAAARIDPLVELIIGGSYRRGSQASNDIDFIVTKPDTESSAELSAFLTQLVARLEKEKFLVARLASTRSGTDGTKWHGCCVLPRRIKGINDINDDNGADYPHKPIWRRIDFLLVPASEMGAALIYFTGNDIFNRSMRLLAQKKGMRLNQRGLYRDVTRGPGRTKGGVTREDLIEGRDERRIFEVLGVKWREPHERWC